jgi:hypothetical protein
MTRLLAAPAYRQYRAALQWDDRYTGLMSGTTCNFDNRTSAGALAAWRAMTTTSFAARSSCDIGDCPAKRRPSRIPLMAVVAVALIVAAGVRRSRQAPVR